MLPQENFVSTPLRNRHPQVGQSPQSRRKFGKSVESTKPPPSGPCWSRSAPTLAVATCADWRLLVFNNTRASSDVKRNSPEFLDSESPWLMAGFPRVFPDSQPSISIAALQFQAGHASIAGGLLQDNRIHNQFRRGGRFHFNAVPDSLPFQWTTQRTHHFADLAVGRH